jgi:hypothetical protein
MGKQVVSPKVLSQLMWIQLTTITYKVLQLKNELDD